MNFSNTANAELISKREIFNKILFSEFEFTFYPDGKESNRLFNLVTEDYDLKLVWKIYRVFFDQKSDGVYLCQWSQIQLDKSDKKFFGNLEIKMKSGMVFKTTFDSYSLPLKNDLGLRYCEDLDDITIKIQVYREDESLFSTLKTYEKFFENNESADFVFVCGNETISANKSILSSQSHVFASMFADCDGDTKEITDVEPRIFNLMLRFIYCGKLELINNDNLLKVFELANKYSVKSLAYHCGYRLTCNLTVKNAIDDLVVADRVRDDFLKKECVDFIIKYKDEIVDTEAYKNVLVKKRADLLSEIFCRIKSCD